ncbi:hypothetical protein JRQ81_008125 [Phrynocephalus forsythii]|uniref:E3 ubiquitin-protein ligase RNFT1 n=1 Tax=Phrynocephalus forsythii TaxID=171643 RepID=A0A9Q0XBA3_9SAUR|nr:hypothetical protein JRQ81_008125 [Phrynocephalus forsythii]
MKPRPRQERVPRPKPQAFGAAGCPLRAMQPGSSNHHGGPGIEDGAAPCPSAHATKGSGEGSCQCPGGDVRIPLSSPPGEAGANAGPRQPPRMGAQGRSQAHAHGEARAAPDSVLDLEEQSGSALAELRHLFHWLHKSLPYLLILSVKLLMQHISGISLEIGLLATFMYANKSIVNQVFLRDKCSRLQCAWLLVFLVGSSVLLYYTFYAQSLHYSLIFLSPAVDLTNIWEVLWTVGTTDFILKFLFMSCKLIVLLLPSLVMSFKSKGYWYMLLEELSQYYRTMVPIPVWFWYLVGLKELDGALRWSFGVLVALLYLILKLLSFFGHLKHFRQVLRIFCTRPSYGVAAGRRQCAEAGEICSICQAEFQKPVLLICQHIFCEECITLWFNKEKTCPLCRTAIADHVQKWKDGGTTMHLQLY